MRKSLLLGSLLLLVGCAHSQYTPLTDRKIEEPKVIALSSSREPWVIEIEKRLKAAGFKVLRTPSRVTAKEQVSETRQEVFKVAEARYVLMLDGDAYLDRANRCFGGGYKFEYLNAELVDSTTNETMFSLSDGGYSEGCPPLSGKLYGNIIEAVNKAWK